MPRDKLLGDGFKIQKFKWYLVDLRDYHKPVLVRKHLDSKQQAIQFRDKYYDKNFEVIYWKEAKKYGLSDHISNKRGHKHHTGKYNYPPGVVSQYDRQLFRNTQRQKARQKMRRPKVNETVVWEIIDDKPVLFVKRVSLFRQNHWVYTEPVEGLKAFLKEYSDLNHVRYLCNIVRAINAYYDVGLYDMAEVAFLIYKKWGNRIRRHCDNVRAIPSKSYKVVKELKARGFIKLDDCDFEKRDSYIESTHLIPTLAHPEICWFDIREKELYDHYIYDFHRDRGIAGYTRAVFPGPEKKKRR